MKIVSLESENIKRLTAVRIEPDGNLVEITGRNGAGKSSVLDSIFYALAGTSDIPARPIRKGAEEARIRLDMGELVITRRFKHKAEDGDKYTTAITVENADGARFQSPQTMLDGLLGALCLDPLEFARSKPKEQFDTLKGFVPGFDFEAHRKRREDIFAARTEANRKAKELRAQVAGIPDNSETIEAVDLDALVDQLSKAGEHNAAIEREKEGRERSAAAKDAFRESAATYRKNAEDLRRQADEQDRRADDDDAAAKRIEEQIASAEPLPDPIDTDDLRKRIADGRDINARVEEAERRETQRTNLIEQAKAKETESTESTRAIETLDREKADAIAGAKLPVEGISFADDEVLLNGFPFNQASDAEQLKVSVLIAMAMNPKLRVLRIRDGSLLDDEAMKLLAQMADQHDFQVWIERVKSDATTGFIIEDGHVRGQVLEAAE